MQKIGIPAVAAAVVAAMVAVPLVLVMMVGGILGEERATPRSGAAICATPAAGPAYEASQPTGPQLNDTALQADTPQVAAKGAAPVTDICATGWTGGDTGCVEEDPTSGGCLTGATRHALDEVIRVFGTGSESPIRATGCWDAHAWNPSSDHPKGRACDFFPGTAGVFASDEELDAGWEVAEWFRANAEALQVSYVIWQGRIWSAGGGDTDTGWGRPYNGGGVYDPDEATGGHFDHIHVSFRR